MRCIKEKRSYPAALRRILIRFRTPTGLLFPTLTSLLQPTTPQWLRSPISKYLSLLPLRQEGVRYTLNFIASSAPQEPRNPADYSGGQTSGPTLTLEVLGHASRLLSSVPSSITAEDYFAGIAPQLLHLLNDKNPDNPRAAAYIIGNGILGRQKYGSPSAIGWKVIAEPIIQSLNPVAEKYGPARTEEPPPVRVSEASLELAVGQLASLVLLHPNPGLTKRLVTPCALSLWGLCCYSKNVNRSNLSQMILSILRTYYKTSVGAEELINLSDSLLWDGERSWTYGPGSAGGVEIRQRCEDNSLPNVNLIVMMQRIDSRVDEFMELLKSAVADNDEIGALFVHVSKHALVVEKVADGSNRLDAAEDERMDPLYSLLYAKLTQKLLEKYKDQLARTPKRIIELVNQLLTAYVMKYEEKQARLFNAANPSFAGLRGIVNPDFQSDASASVTDRPHQEDSTEMISVALSLLTEILSSPEFSLDPAIFTLLGYLQDILIRFTTSEMSLPVSTTVTATNILGLLDIHRSLLSTPPIEGGTRSSADPYAIDRKSHLQALSYLADPLPPIRAQGIAQLTSLITKSSPILDIPSTSILLQSVLQDEDEFIYLSVIKTLGLLASRHPKTVVRRLVESYVDVSEDVELDVRIRTGEALLKTLEGLGGALLVGDTAKMVGEALISVAGRRGNKPEAQNARQERLQSQRNSEKEADEAWGGEAPVPDMNEDGGEKLLRAWKSPHNDDPEDDIRIRTSALSILAVAIETNTLAIGLTLVSTALDLVLSLLRLEIGPELAILRRAAVLVIASVLKALDAVGQSLGFWLATGEVMDVLRLLEAREEDAVVLGHVRGVIESLEAWQSKILLGSVGKDVRFGLEELKGLAVNSDASKGGKPYIEEVE